MSVRVMAWAFDQAPTTNPTDQLVLLAIADRCNEDGLEAWPSLETLAKKTRLCERAVWEAVKRLKAIGVLKVHHGRGRVRSNHYEIVMGAGRTTCDIAPYATSQEVPAQGRTTCNRDVAPRANDPSTDTSVTSGTEELLEPVPRTLHAEDLKALWNTVTQPPIPRCKELTSARRKQADARLRERGLDGMREVFSRINALPFCRGENDRGWRATFDWALKPGTVTKVLEGAYDDGRRHRSRITGRTGAPPHGTYDGVMES